RPRNGSKKHASWARKNVPSTSTRSPPSTTARPKKKLPRPTTATPFGLPKSVKHTPSAPPSRVEKVRPPRLRWQRNTAEPPRDGRGFACSSLAARRSRVATRTARFGARCHERRGGELVPDELRGDLTTGGTDCRTARDC